MADRLNDDVSCVLGARYWMFIKAGVAKAKSELDEHSLPGS